VSSGRRWNLNVRDWLYQHCHRPLVAAGRPLAGVAFAFLASALLHCWFVAVALGSAGALDELLRDSGLLMVADRACANDAGAIARHLDDRAVRPTAIRGSRF
jgi:hypothetical protein